jgi:predicted metal-binding membrane protein
MTTKRSLAIAVGVLGAAFIAWLFTVERMQGMNAGPGTDLGALGWYVGVWVTMMAAMMLPAVLPVVLLFARVSSERMQRGKAAVGTPVFLLGYLAVWTAFGLVAYAIFRAIVDRHFMFLQWDEQGRYVAAAAIGVAALYQLTPLKRVCLRHCRSPLALVLGHWREGRFGAVRMGAEHGGWCVGCCWGLMLALFAVGVMSIAWMVIIAALIFVEKVLPRGERLTVVLGVVLLALAVWVAASPGSVPWLVQPGTGGMSGMDGMNM